MLRISCLVIVALALALPAAAEPRPDGGKNPGPVGQAIGSWTVTFANGVVESCGVRADGAAWVREPQRAAAGKAQRSDAAVVITFDDDRVERWTPVGNWMVVEHWFPAAQYPAGPRVLGIANRVP